jgi:hypothetical protein
VVRQCVAKDVIFSCHKLIPFCLKTPSLIGVYLTSCRMELGLVRLVDVVNFTSDDCSLFQFGDNTVFTIDCGSDNPLKSHCYIIILLQLFSHYLLVDNDSE